MISISIVLLEFIIRIEGMSSKFNTPLLWFHWPFGALVRGVVGAEVADAVTSGDVSVPLRW